MTRRGMRAWWTGPFHKGDFARVWYDGRRTMLAYIAKVEKSSVARYIDNLSANHVHIRFFIGVLRPCDVRDVFPMRSLRMHVSTVRPPSSPAEDDCEKSQCSESAGQPPRSPRPTDDSGSCRATCVSESPSRVAAACTADVFACAEAPSGQLADGGARSSTAAKSAAAYLAGANAKPRADGDAARSK